VAEFGAEFDKTHVVIWTTTPWTIPQNRAICYNPTISYGLYEVTEAPADNWAKIGDKLILADKLAQDVMDAARVDGFARLRDASAAVLGSLTCAHPLNGIHEGGGEWNYDVPMLEGGHVTDDAGTGFVHTAPSHGDDDYAVGVKHGLEMTYNILDDSSYRPDLPLFGGEQVIKPNGKPGGANKAVIAALSRVGAVFTKKGAAFSDDDYLLRNEAVNTRILEAFEAEGADAWYKEGAKQRFLEGIVDPDAYDQVMDILDVWFDSGSTHAFTR